MNYKRGNIFIYSIFLVFFMVIFAYIVAEKTEDFDQTITTQNTSDILDKDILNKAKFATKGIFYNSGSFDSIYGYIDNNSGFKNIFWNNSQFNDFLTFYTGTYSLLSNTSSGMLYLSTNTKAELKIFEFDRNVFDSSDRLVIKNEWNGVFGTGITGYLTLSGSYISINSSTGSAFLFDFKNKDYGVFLNYSGSIDNGLDTMKYSLNGVDFLGNPITINPVNNLGLDYFKFLGNDVILLNPGIIHKQEISNIPVDEKVILQNIID